MSENNFWAPIRSRDVLVGLGYFVFANVLLLGILALAGDYLGQNGSNGARVAFGIIVVAVNFLLWLWNDSGIKDVAASNKDMTEEQRKLAISQEFLKAPWALYRVLILVITIAVTGGLLYGIFS